MTLADVPAGSAIFIDANVFVYAFAPDPSLGPACDSFVRRVRKSELFGYTSSHVLSGVAHRLMTLEACSTFGWSYPGIANRLKQRHSEIAKLVKYQAALDEIVRAGVQVLDTFVADVVAAAKLSPIHGLLSGDALILATMQRAGITSIGSNDSDFDRIPGIVRFEIG